MPDRTTIVMPEPLKRRAVAKARQEGISFGELVRRAVEKEVSAATKNRGRKTGDPFLDGIKIFDVDGPADLSVNHDDYIYGGGE